MSKIPCEIIQDLLPSYIDELTSDVTNREVEAHMEGCEQCRNVFEQMKAPDIEMADKEEKEIDFLKKTKKTKTEKALENAMKLILLPKRDQKNITFKSVTIFLH